MNVVFIIPTGIGAKIGGHAGDATPAAKLIAKCCDKLVLHPNVVNASDINEIPSNALYVDGFMLDRFMRGEIWLKEIHSNRILLVVNAPATVDTLNSVNAAHNTIGARIDVIELNTPLTMTARILKDGSAFGSVTGVDDLVQQVADYEFDALAIQTPITVNEEIALHYVEHGGVNPWGGVEALASRMIGRQLNKPIAHSPIETGTLENINRVVDPRMAAEFVSKSYLHCVLKGLHKAPRPGVNGLSIHDVDALVTPHGCNGIPHVAAKNNNISIIVVDENQTIHKFTDPADIHVANYWEAAGYLMAMEAGIDPRTARLS